MSELNDTDTEILNWLMHLRSGQATQEDRQAFQRWCAEHPERARAARMMGATWSGIDSLAARLASQDAARGQLWTGNPHRSRVRPGRRAFVGFALTAGISWLAVQPPLHLWPSVIDLAADYHTDTGEQRRVVLSDRVALQMNTQTRINVLPARAGQFAQRGIDLLAGEVEIVAGVPDTIRITPLRPVAVVAGKGRLQANIASFNVRRIAGTVCVTCLSGSVAFEHPRQRLTLVASQQLTYDDRRVGPVSSVDTDAVTAWRRGTLVFNDVPLAAAIDEINRYRPGKIILRNPQLGRRRIQARLAIADIDRGIEMIREVYGAHLTKLPGNVVLIS